MAQRRCAPLTRGPSGARSSFAFDPTSADGLFAAQKLRILPRNTVMATEPPITSVGTVPGLVGSAFGAAGRVQDY